MLGNTRPDAVSFHRRPGALALSAVVHGMVLAAWMIAPPPVRQYLAAGAMTVELLTERPPEPPTPPQPQPTQPQPPPPVPPKASPRPPARPSPAARQSPAAPAAAESRPLMTEDAVPAPDPAAASTAPAPAVALGTPAGRAVERDDYLRMVWARIMRFRPERVPLAGTTLLRFVVGADGELTSVEVAQSSGSALLDRAALDAMRRAAPFPPPPDSTMVATAFEIPFQFRRNAP